MRTAITGASGFIGGALAQRLGADAVVRVSRRDGVAVDDVEALTRAFTGCDAVVHAAGINREIGAQTYEGVHVQGTASVVEAARLAGVRRIVLVSYLRARPACGSGYHESKWAAEEAVRGSGLTFTVLKPGIVYGRGDHLVDHLSRTALTVPLFATVGLPERAVIAPVPVEELVDVVVAAVDGKLDDRTVAVAGAEVLMLGEAMRRVARVVGRRVAVVGMPVVFHRVLAWIAEATMAVPLLARAQARMLAEGVVTPSGPVDPLPDELRPRARFDEEHIRAALPPLVPFGLADLRCTLAA